MSEFFSPTFWFSLNIPSVTEGPGRVIFAVFVATLVLGLIIRIVATKRSEDKYVTETFRRIGSLLTTMGFFGIILAFFSFERVRFLGARFWYPLWLFGVLIWAFFIVRYVKRDVPEMRKKAIEKEEREKYFPPRKKK